MAANWAMSLGSSTRAVKGAVPWVHPPIANKTFRFGFTVRRLIIFSYCPKTNAGFQFYLMIMGLKQGYRIVMMMMMMMMMMMNIWLHLFMKTFKMILSWDIKAKHCILVLTSSALVVPFISINIVSNNFSKGIYYVSAQKGIYIICSERHRGGAVLCPVCEVTDSFVGLHSFYKNTRLLYTVLAGGKYLFLYGVSYSKYHTNWIVYII